MTRATRSGGWRWIDRAGIGGAGSGACAGAVGSPKVSKVTKPLTKPVVTHTHVFVILRIG